MSMDANMLFDCDCNVGWMIDAVNNGSITFNTGGEPICQDSSKLLDKQKSNLPCPDGYTAPVCTDYYLPTSPTGSPSSITYYLPEVDEPFGIFFHVFIP